MMCVCVGLALGAFCVCIASASIYAPRQADNMCECLRAVQRQTKGLQGNLLCEAGCWSASRESQASEWFP